MDEMLARVRMRAYGTDRAGLRPCFLGLCLIISFSTTMALLTGGSAGLPDVGWLANLVRVVTFLCVALLSGRLGAGHRACLGWLAAGFACAGAACVVVCLWVPAGMPVALQVGGTVLASVGYSLLYLLWIELYAKMDLRHVIMAFTAAHLASAVLSFALAQLGWWVGAALALVAMPALSALCYARGLRASDSLPYMQGEQTASGWTFPLRPVVLLGVFTLANGFVRHYLASDLKGVALLGVIAAAALVFVLVLWCAERFDLGSLYALCLPLVVAGSLCVLVGLPGFGMLGGLLTNAAYTLFSVFVTAVLCSVSYRYGVDALWLFGFSCAAISLGSLGATALSGWVDGFGEGPAVRTLAVCAVVTVFAGLYAGSAGRGVPMDSWGVVRAGQGAPAGEAVESLEERCARIARLRGLTKREEEVMVLLVRGLSFADIEEGLSISNSTLKTHARHIYAKLEVSGRRELAEALERAR